MTRPIIILTCAIAWFFFLRISQNEIEKRGLNVASCQIKDEGFILQMVLLPHRFLSK